MKSAEPKDITLQELQIRAERIAKKVGLSDARQAFQHLDNGKLAGTLAEVELRQIRFLRNGTRSSHS